MDSSALASFQVLYGNKMPLIETCILIDSIECSKINLLYMLQIEYC